MEFKGKIYLAPMNGITNAEFRKNCILHGADVVETPLLSAKAIIANKIKVIEEIKSIANQRPCGVQIFFANCPQAVDACKQILKIFRPDYIDLNMGCPSPRVCREEAGCALMRNPNLIYRIVKNVVKEINVPIVVKIRSG
jgi:tRNA-dihydrouridine synthase